MALVFAVAALGVRLAFESELRHGHSVRARIAPRANRWRHLRVWFDLCNTSFFYIYTCIYLIIVVLPCSIRSCLKWYYLFLTVWMCRGLRFEHFASKMMCLPIRGRTQVDLGWTARTSFGAGSPEVPNHAPIHEAFGSGGMAHKRLGLIQQRTFCDSLNNEQPPRAVLGLQLWA
jgi:hypothetical protein